MDTAGAGTCRWAAAATCVAITVFCAMVAPVRAEELKEELVTKVENQPLGANLIRLLQALDLLGAPVPEKLATRMGTEAMRGGGGFIEKVVDPLVLCVVNINPESRVKVTRGAAPAVLTQGGYTPVIIKVVNEATVTERLRIGSPQAGPVYAGAARFSLDRQQQTGLADNQNEKSDPHRFLDVDMFTSPPMLERLSGLEVEYVIALLYSRDAGKREATLTFDIGQGTQDLGFRAELPVLFQIRPAVPVRLKIRDEEGQPTVARLEIRDAAGHVYPSQPKRLAPDLFFQPQIYRRDGDVLYLPPGKFEVASSRGPEYKVLKRELVVPAPDTPAIATTSVSPQPVEKMLEFAAPLERWVAPAKYGFYAGDHHIHAGGCAHYQVPTEGVGPRDMLLQVKGEGLNVGCILNWGYCYEHQRAFFSPQADKLSEPLTLLKYDLEVSGFGSAAMGHVCLLNLRDQTYPGSAGTIKNWPTWTVPVLKWAKEQGGITGYPHSDMRVDPPAAAKRLMQGDASRDGLLSLDESAALLMPEPFKQVDRDGNGFVSELELTAAVDRAANELPNMVLPSMNGSGAMEIFVSTPAGVCDFISAMDTGRVGEWNTWYHLLNCGFPLKVSGETDFPCMSSLRVGQGRVYVQLGELERLDFSEWCDALVQGRSYVSDGYAHALQFTVNGQAPGFEDIALAEPATVEVRAKVAFGAETPLAVAHGTSQPPEGRREVGDTRILHGKRGSSTAQGGERLIELVCNGQVIARKPVPADGQEHDVSFQVQVQRSCWLALRHFPQLHTNPVNVIVAKQPLHVSKQSARWCREAVALLWEKRHEQIAAGERPAARTAYDAAIARYREVEKQAIDDSAPSAAEVR